MILEAEIQLGRVEDKINFENEIFTFAAPATYAAWPWIIDGLLVESEPSESIFWLLVLSVRMKCKERRSWHWKPNKDLLAIIRASLDIEWKMAKSEVKSNKAKNCDTVIHVEIEPLLA